MHKVALKISRVANGGAEFRIEARLKLLASVSGRARWQLSISRCLTNGASTRTRKHAHTHAYTHAHTHACTHAHIQQPSGAGARSNEHGHGHAVTQATASDATQRRCARFCVPETRRGKNPSTRCMSGHSGLVTPRIESGNGWVSDSHSHIA